VEETILEGRLHLDMYGCGDVLPWRCEHRDLCHFSRIS